MMFLTYLLATLLCLGSTKATGHRRSLQSIDAINIVLRGVTFLEEECFFELDEITAVEVSESDIDLSFTVSIADDSCSDLIAAELGIAVAEGVDIVSGSFKAENYRVSFVASEIGQEYPTDVILPSEEQCIDATLVDAEDNEIVESVACSAVEALVKPELEFLFNNNFTDKFPDRPPVPELVDQLAEVTDRLLIELNAVEGSAFEAADSSNLFPTLAKIFDSFIRAPVFANSIDNISRLLDGLIVLLEDGPDGAVEFIEEASVFGPELLFIFSGLNLEDFGIVQEDFDEAIAFIVQGIEDGVFEDPNAEEVTAFVLGLVEIFVEELDAFTAGLIAGAIEAFFTQIEGDGEIVTAIVVTLAFLDPDLLLQDEILILVGLIAFLEGEDINGFNVADLNDIVLPVLKILSNIFNGIFTGAANVPLVIEILEVGGVEDSNYLLIEDVEAALIDLFDESDNLFDFLIKLVDLLFVFAEAQEAAAGDYNVSQYSYYGGYLDFEDIQFFFGILIGLIQEDIQIEDAIVDILEFGLGIPLTSTILDAILQVDFFVPLYGADLPLDDILDAAPFIILSDLQATLEEIGDEFLLAVFAIIVQNLPPEVAQDLEAATIQDILDSFNIDSIPDVEDDFEFALTEFIVSPQFALADFIAGSLLFGEASFLSVTGIQIVDGVVIVNEIHINEIQVSFSVSIEKIFGIFPFVLITPGVLLVDINGIVFNEENIAEFIIGLFESGDVDAYIEEPVALAILNLFQSNTKVFAFIELLFVLANEGELGDYDSNFFGDYVDFYYYGAIFDIALLLEQDINEVLFLVGLDLPPANVRLIDILELFFVEAVVAFDSGFLVALFDEFGLSGEETDDELIVQEATLVLTSSPLDSDRDNNEFIVFPGTKLDSTDFSIEAIVLGVPVTITGDVSVVFQQAFIFLVDYERVGNFGFGLYDNFPATEEIFTDLVACGSASAAISLEAQTAVADFVPDVQVAEEFQDEFIEVVLPYLATIFGPAVPTFIEGTPRQFVTELPALLDPNGLQACLDNPFVENNDDDNLAAVIIPVVIVGLCVVGVLAFFVVGGAFSGQGGKKPTTTEEEQADAEGEIKQKV